MNIVVVTHNLQSMMFNLLSRLSMQSVPTRVIISDDGSTPPVVGAVHKCVWKHLWTRHDGKYHRVARYNEGLACVDEEFVIFLDDDCEPESLYFAQAYQDQLANCDVVRGLFKDGDYHKLTPWFSTANVGFRTSALCSLGGFDPAYDGKYGYEDVDLEQAIKKAGLRVEMGEKHTAVEHLGKPYAGDRYVTQINEKYYRAKWGL